jgi:DUF1680 family protein
MNAQQALQHQWQQLEESGCIDNFRLLAGGKTGFRTGWFFADSDAYKWLDAASRAVATHPSGELTARIDRFIALLQKAQADDGYLYTYNQLHFPKARWANLQIEHELYCHGHLIEAAVSHYQATGQRSLLAVGERAADLLIRDFVGTGPERTPGHQEIEIALLRLARATGKEAYRTLARQFVEQRGRITGFARQILREKRNVDRRSGQVEQKRVAHAANHPEKVSPRLPAGNRPPRPPGIQIRYLLSALSGRYFQQDRPVRQRTVPVGHAVRFTYLQTAAAMLARQEGDKSLLVTLDAAWEHMVNRRMYVTGGIGSLPVIEGFGRDYELDPEYAYAEACAALGCLFWNWEMTLAMHQAKYADLFEWQLYNAASVGMGLDGRSYLYNNPLACRGGVTRQPWYEVPCCPSNLSRTWAALGRYLVSTASRSLWIHQYVGSSAEVDLGLPVQVEMQSGFPWHGQVRLQVTPAAPAQFTLHLRVPSWTGEPQLRINGRPLDRREPPQVTGDPVQPASGYCPQRAYYLPLSRLWSPGDSVEIEFPFPIIARRTHPRVRSGRGRVALSRGPIVYCLESVDNPGLDPFNARVDVSTLRAEPSPDQLGGIWLLQGETVRGKTVAAIPYYAWANRGPSKMAVWLRD